MEEIRRWAEVYRESFVREYGAAVRISLETSDAGPRIVAWLSGQHTADEILHHEQIIHAFVEGRDEQALGKLAIRYQFMPSEGA